MIGFNFCSKLKKSNLWAIFNRSLLKIVNIVSSDSPSHDMINRSCVQQIGRERLKIQWQLHFGKSRSLAVQNCTQIIYTHPFKLSLSLSRHYYPSFAKAYLLALAFFCKLRWGHEISKEAIIIEIPLVIHRETGSKWIVSKTRYFNTLLMIF